MAARLASLALLQLLSFVGVCRAVRSVVHDLETRGNASDHPQVATVVTVPQGVKVLTVPQGVQVVTVPQGKKAGPTCYFSQQNGAAGTWMRYVANPRTVLVIGPGSGPMANQVAWANIGRQFDLVFVTDFNYDNTNAKRTPPGWDQGRPLLSAEGGYNLANFAHVKVVPMIAELVKAGRGPAVVVAGSRGGQVVLPELWRTGWRGPTVCMNGGFTMTNTIVPKEARVAVELMSHDYFWTKDPNYFVSHLQRQDPTANVLMYQDHLVAHNPDNARNTQALPILIRQVRDGFHDLEAQSWPEKSSWQLV